MINGSVRATLIGPDPSGDPRVRSMQMKISFEIHLINYWKALTEVENVLLLDGDNYNAKMFRGKILVEQKKFRDAENDFRSCVDAEPDKALGYQEFDLI